jgi:hypothetical protein
MESRRQLGAPRGYKHPRSGWAKQRRQLRRLKEEEREKRKAAISAIEKQLDDISIADADDSEEEEEVEEQEEANYVGPLFFPGEEKYTAAVEEKPLAAVALQPRTDHPPNPISSTYEDLVKTGEAAIDQRDERCIGDEVIEAGQVFSNDWLPYEVLVHIFVRLDPISDLIQARLVSKAWKRFISDTPQLTYWFTPSRATTGRARSSTPKRPPHCKRSSAQKRPLHLPGFEREQLGAMAEANASRKRKKNN